jgi:mono/diheme cytochrome c family protein
MRQRSNVLALAMVMLIGSVPSAWAATGQAAATGGAPDRGATVYAAQKCSMCHALDGRGMAKGPLDGVGSKLSAEEIRQWIVNPAEMTAKTNATRKPLMRAYPNLPKEDLDALVAFLHAKKKTP